MSTPAVRFQEVFGFTPRAGTGPYKTISHGAVLAKLRQLARAVWQLERELNAIAAKYGDPDTEVGFEEAQTDIELAEWLTEEIDKAAREFTRVAEIAEENKFSVSCSLEDHIPPVDLAGPQGE